MPTERSTGSSQLIVRTKDAVHRLHPGSSYRVGRNPEADVVVADPRVSWEHAILRGGLDGWFIEDRGSTNGTFADGERVGRIRVDGDRVIRLGNPETGATLAFSIAAPPADPRPRADRPPGFAVPPPVDPRPRADRPPGSAAPPPVEPRPRADRSPGSAPPAGHPGPRVDRSPSSVIQLPPRAATRTLRIGRATDNDIVLSDLVVSRHHAELRATGDGRYRIVDLGGHNGTFVNGIRTNSAVLGAEDIVGIGHATFRLVGDQLQEYLDTGEVAVSAQALTVRTPEGKVILDHVSFPIPERCLVGVIGPSGAGKSTLLGAVTGTRPASEGAVVYDGRDLYTDYAELRHRIGLVPQEDILHTQLRARRALRYAAELRFPGDTKAAERDRRVEEVLAELGLGAHADTKISSLSGGQRKRVSVALELLTKPSLLFLDEPTSGLDPGLDKSVMELMAELAHEGRTVIVVTHSVANLNACDRLLVLVPGGRVAYYGPPQEGLAYFGLPGWADVFQAFDREPDRDWAAEFRRSPQHARYVEAGLNPGRTPVGPPRMAPPRPPRAQGRLAQLSTLCRRYLSVIASDRSFLILLAVMPLILGGLILAIPDPGGLVPVAGPGGNTDATSKMLVLVFGACFVGTGNSVREMIKERPIFRRERAAGLSAGVYLTSKLLVLGVITGVQSALLVAIGLLGHKLPPDGTFTAPLPELMISMGVLGIVSMILGLIVSAAVGTSEKTLPLLVVISMGQLVLCGALIQPLAGKPGLEQLAWLSPSRWGLAAAAATIDLSKVAPTPGKPDGLWEHTSATWLMDMGILVGSGIIFALITWWMLLRQRPGRR
ncbi:FHA domain-containing protein [Actinomadura scrupuli]|uniref:FHA domain-containing protein n=1 Tax=Actinomadura scrupuli TaxID=559629 RepID=UPI003D99672B